MKKKNSKQQAMQVVALTVVCGAVLVATVEPAYADALAKIETNASNLGTRLSGIVTSLAGASTAGKVGWHMWMKSMADGDQGAVQDHNKRMKNTLIWGGGITAVGGILTAVVGELAKGI